MVGKVGLQGLEKVSVDNVVWIAIIHEHLEQVSELCEPELIRAAVFLGPMSERFHGRHFFLPSLGAGVMNVSICCRGFPVN